MNSLFYSRTELLVSKVDKTTAFENVNINGAYAIRPVDLSRPSIEVASDVFCLVLSQGGHLLHGGWGGGGGLQFSVGKKAPQSGAGCLF